MIFNLDRPNPERITLLNRPGLVNAGGGSRSRSRVRSEYGALRKPFPLYVSDYIRHGIPTPKRVPRVRYLSDRSHFILPCYLTVDDNAALRAGPLTSLREGASGAFAQARYFTQVPIV